MKTPNLGEAHCGEGALQSQQMLFLGSFWRAASYLGQFLSVLCVYGRRRKGYAIQGRDCPCLPWTASQGRPPTLPWWPLCRVRGG